MTKNFENKVMMMGRVDTAKYRYVIQEYADHAEIQRIELCKLGTTAVLSDWETVKRI